MKRKTLSLVSLILILLAFSFYYHSNFIPDRLEPLSYDALNEEIKIASTIGETWNFDPLEVALHLSGDMNSKVNRDISIVTNNNQVTVTIVDDGYRDDSIRGKKIVIQLQQDENKVWYVTDAIYGFRCQDGRGHQNYTCEPCS